MDTLTAIRSLQQRRASILASISAIGDLRPGSVSEFFTECGRPNCHCQQEDDPGHGPYFRLVFNSASKRTCRSISARQAKVLSAEVAECQRLRHLLGELIEVSEQLSEIRLQNAGSDTSPRPSKKKSAHRSSSPPSKPRSPAS